MRNKRQPETPEDRNERTQADARQRIEQAAAETKTLDAAVRQSIRLYGP